MRSSEAVALRKESVDRNNFSRLHNYIGVMVALRKESVDRNREIIIPAPPIVIVALRKESVDRNINREISLMRP